MYKPKPTAGKKSVKKSCKKTTLKTDPVKQARIAGFSKTVKAILLEKLQTTDEFLDAQDMKQLFKKGDNTLANWRKSGMIVGSKTGRGYVYHKAMVYAMLINTLPKG